MQWHRGRAERRGKLLDAGDHANHLAGGLADAGYFTMLPDIRHYFEHGWRWHVWFAGRTPALRQPALKYQTTSRHAVSAGALCVSEDEYPLDLGVLRAFCGGRSARTMFGCAQNAKVGLLSARGDGAPLSAFACGGFQTPVPHVVCAPPQWRRSSVCWSRVRGGA